MVRPRLLRRTRPARNSWSGWTRASRERYLQRLKERRADREKEAKVAAAAAARESRTQKLWRDTARVTIYPVLTMCLPVAICLAGFFAITAPIAASLAGLASLYGIPLALLTSDKALNAIRWEMLSSRLRVSSDPIERDSLFMGINAADGSPVLVPRTVFQEHAHLLGDSGSGKTSLGLAPLISQLIRYRDCSVVIIDLKADDLALFEGARIEADKAGLRCRWFTNQLRQPTYGFNPLTQAHIDQLSLYQRVDMLTAAPWSSVRHRLRPRILWRRQRPGAPPGD